MSEALRLIFASVMNTEIRTILLEEAGAAIAALIVAVQQKLSPYMAACIKALVDPRIGSSIKKDHHKLS